ncbi:uncharacterized protein TNCT_369551 [Trichonephila clavata]|uniref:Uncharacterized protein n=1 Tax=Trichonephila clavata TaxID=2740835 RepID=A0A8X6I4L2_TRICU|nr:uncharacterized protein TNCT_369551 [Trichonephila clavata]
MAMTKVAITVCLDPEILNFVKISGCASFVFPSKETHLYLDVDNPKKETWIWKDYITKNFSDPYVPIERILYADIRLVHDVTRENILPFARWEELVKERISHCQSFYSMNCSTWCAQSALK